MQTTTRLVFFWSIINFLVISSFFHKLTKLPCKIKEILKNMKKQNMIRKMMIDLKNTSLELEVELELEVA